MKDNTIKVSVICLAYNHEKHILRALEGFVNQETDFAYEVLIHDDCSTDGTAAIIQDYAHRYPEIIKPILQTENQFSKGIWIDRDIIAPRARGAYVAYCEGDDYWSDPHKLQKQYDFLSVHPEYSACVHKTVFHNLITAEDYLVPAINKDRDYSLDEIVMTGGGIFGTNSLMMRREIICDMPDCFKVHGVSDYQMFMHAAIEGKVRCLNAAMSVYNIGVEGSWTQRMLNDKEFGLKHCYTILELIKQVDTYYGGKYHQLMHKKLTEINYLILKIKGDRKSMRRPEYLPFCIRDIKTSIKVKLATALPLLVKIKHLIKGR